MTSPTVPSTIPDRPTPDCCSSPAWPRPAPAQPGICWSHTAPGRKEERMSVVTSQSCTGLRGQIGLGNIHRRSRWESALKRYWIFYGIVRIGRKRVIVMQLHINENFYVLNSISSVLWCLWSVKVRRMVHLSLARRFTWLILRLWMVDWIRCTLAWWGSHLTGLSQSGNMPGEGGELLNCICGCETEKMT